MQNTRKFSFDCPNRTESVTAWLLHGPNLPTKVSVGSLDCPAAIHLDIANRSLKGAQYDQATQIESAELALMTGDKSYQFRMSQLNPTIDGYFDSTSAPTVTQNRISTATPLTSVPSSAWIAVKPTGHTLVILSHPDALTPRDVQRIDKDVILIALMKAVPGDCSIIQATGYEFTIESSVNPITG